MTMRKKFRKMGPMQPETSAADAEKIKKQKELISKLEKSLRVQKSGFLHEINGIQIRNRIEYE